MTSALGQEQLDIALRNQVFYEGDEPRLHDLIIFGCLSEDTGGSLTFAITFAAIVRQIEASGEENPCVQALLEPAIAALSKPNPTEEEMLAVFAFFFGLISCGFEATAPSPGTPEG